MDELKLTKQVLTEVILDNNKSIIDTPHTVVLKQDQYEDGVITDGLLVINPNKENS